MTQRIIRCRDLTEMVTACALLVPLGVTFTACTTTNTITLTGGY